MKRKLMINSNSTLNLKVNSFVFFKIPGLESPSLRHSPLPPPKVIKSILKKNKNSTPPNVQNSISSNTPMHNPPFSQNNESKDFVEHKSIKPSSKGAHLKQKLSNGQNGNKVHIEGGQNMYNNDKCDNNQKEEDIKKVRKNDVASKARKHLQTVQVDIH